MSDTTNRPWPYDGPAGRARLTGNLGGGEMGLCMVGDITDGQDCRRLAQIRWQIDPDDYPVDLCNYHSEPFTSSPGLARQVSTT